VLFINKSVVLLLAMGQSYRQAAQQTNHVAHSTSPWTSSSSNPLLCYSLFHFIVFFWEFGLQAWAQALA
jgi:hypothetical protein